MPTFQTPGPAAYKVVDPYVYMQKAPQFSMTGRNFAPGETTRKPGPGEYRPELVRNLMMSYLTVTKAPNIQHFIRSLTFLSSQVTSTRFKAPSFTFGLRHSQFIAPLIVDVPE